jgi:VWFA-related protein
MLRKPLKKSSIILIVLVTSIMSFTMANAQASHWINIDSLSNKQFPVIEADISASDVQGFPIQGLNQSNFSVSEDGQKVGTFDVSSFLNTDKPLAIALVIDTSGSMSCCSTPTPLQAAVQSAKTFVASLTPNDNVAVISFSDTVNVVQNLTTNKTLVNTALDSLQPVHNTALYDAIVEGVNVLKNRSERRIIILLTDGSETSPRISQFSFDEAVNQAQQWAIPVYPIGFGQVNSDELEKLAKITGGSVQIQPDTTALQSAFTQILQILRLQYKLNYTSNIPSDGKDHTLLVGVDFQGKHDEVSRTFVAQLPNTIKITKPADGDTLKDVTATISIDTYALSSVDNVELFLDGNSVKKFDSGPYEYTWDISNVPEGSHTINVVLTAKDGSVVKDAVNVTVVKTLAPNGGRDSIWFAGLIVLAVAAILIPMSLRSRRKRGKALAGAPASAALTGTPCLRELEGMSPGQVWPLGTAEVHLGRKREENDIPLQGLKASRKHAVVRFENGQYVLYSLNPANPAIVNGAPVSDSYVLRPGDTLQLGETVLRYEH